VREVALVIPAHDEEGALPPLLTVLPPEVGAVIVVDQGSRDRTAEVARNAGATVLDGAGLGYGAACRLGIQHLATLAERPSVVVFTDTDQRDPGAIGPLVAPLLQDEADLVLGVRSDGHRAVLPLHGRWGFALTLSLVRRWHGLTPVDLPPLRAIRWEALMALELDEEGWGWPLQMQLRAHHRGLRVRELLLPTPLRRPGRPRVAASLLDSIRIAGARVRTLRRERSAPRPASGRS
jgi:glycosyltransferase involved in cell wall biosynthesis